MFFLLPETGVDLVNGALSTLVEGEIPPQLINGPERTASGDEVAMSRVKNVEQRILSLYQY
jgi:hypothetical protein